MIVSIALRAWLQVHLRLFGRLLRREAGGAGDRRHEAAAAHDLWHAAKHLKRPFLVDVEVLIET